jgi:tetratricopeptide (TPR) repeat protein
MVHVFLSHSSKDKPFARDLKSFLEEGRDVEVWLDEREIDYSADFLSKIAEGLTKADAVLLVLSADAAASKWVEMEWNAAVAKGKQVAVVQCGDCDIPILIASKKFFDTRKNRLDEFPKIKSWLLSMQPHVPPAFHVPARPPLFVGREAELDALRESLKEEGAVVPVEGLPGLGKTTLALEFAHRHKLDFEAVYWVQCVGRDLAALASELAAQLGVKLEGDLEAILRQLRGECGRKRCLLVLDNVEDEAPGRLIPGGRAAVLVTTRRDYLAFLAHRDAVKPELFTEEECLGLFRRVLGDKEVAKSEAAAKVLFERLGYLPIAISVAAGLITHDRHYTIGGLAEKLPALEELRYGADNVGALMAGAIAAVGRNEKKLLKAMAVCAPEGFRLGLAREVAKLGEKAAVDAVHELVLRSLVEELDRESRWYRVHALVRVAAGAGDALRMRHAKAVLKRFQNWETDWRECERDLGDMRQAVGWALEGGVDEERWRLVSQLAVKGYSLTKRIGRLPEAYQYSERLARSAEARGDKWVLQNWSGGQALILWLWGRLDDALALHKKQEVICEDLGHRAGLQRSYGNQALILQNWGRLDEALALHKKGEAICEELGDRDGLQASYGNQAVILQAWGRLEEALALHKKKEAICEELGNRHGLQISYGNQAVILQAWGRLEEALALHKKKEAICEELGNRDGLQASYGNQALILKEWGRLEEALALLKKKEAICEELGNRQSLARCYWFMADLALEQGDSEEARTRAKGALSIFTELKMPSEVDSVKELIDRIGEG